jgi:hypothetical protein
VGFFVKKSKLNSRERVLCSKAVTQTQKLFFLFQIRVYLDDGFEKAQIVWKDFANLTVTSWNRGQTLAREWTRAVNFGNTTLEEIIFSEEIRQEQVLKG